MFKLQIRFMKSHINYLGEICTILILDSKYAIISLFIILLNISDIKTIRNLPL